MATMTRRKYPRYSDHAPILYAGYTAQSYCEAMMHNSSFDGMYFESGTSLDPKCDLFIKAQQHLTRISEPDSCNDFRAIVKWCHPVLVGEKPGYGVGVQIVVRSHLSYGLNTENSGYICDRCEKRVTDKLIHRTASWLLLCQDCLHYMESLPNVLEKSVERFLLGNVV